LKVNDVGEFAHNPFVAVNVDPSTGRPLRLGWPRFSGATAVRAAATATTARPTVNAPAAAPATRNQVLSLMAIVLSSSEGVASGYS
jgi:hypothetical protein